MKKWNYENEQYTKLPAELKHLPLFTRHFDFTSWVFRCLWGFLMKQVIFRFYVRIKTHGSFKEIYKKHPRLLIISNHTSHIDTTVITAAIPFKYWLDLYIGAAKDYWFSNTLFTFFSKHCLGAIPIDRKEKSSESIKLIIRLLKALDRIWMIIYPEGTRSQDGYIKEFKRGISIFSKKTETPILFLYMEGSSRLMPKGSFPKAGTIELYIGPVQPPADIDEISSNYKKWVKTINPKAFKEDNKPYSAE